MAGLFFALMTFFVRMAGSLPTMQKAFFRNAVAAVAALFLLARSEEGFKIKKSSWNVETPEQIVATGAGLLITPELVATDSFALPKSIIIQSDNEKVAKAAKNGKIKTIAAGSAKLKYLLPNTNEKNAKTIEVKLVVRPDRVKIKKAEKKGGRGLLLQWKKVQGASGYIIEYAKKIEKIDNTTFAISEYKHWEESHSYLITI